MDPARRVRAPHQLLLGGPGFERALGIAAFVALAAEVLLLPRLLGFEEWLWRVVLHGRGCGSDAVVERALAIATSSTIGMLAAAAVMRLRRDGAGVTWPPLAVCALGVHTGKVLKNVFVRDRPSMLPEMGLGHSFPSGHVMNTAIAALVLIVFTAEFRHPWRWRLAAGAALAVVVGGRLLLARHWLLDVVAGVLAAAVVVGVGLPAVRRRPLVVPLVTAGMLTFALALVVRTRSAAIRLPSPLSGPGPATIEVELDDAAETARMHGDWDPMRRDDKGQPVTWLRGEGTVSFVLSEADARVAPDAGAGSPPRSTATIVIAARPDTDVKERACGVVRVAVNDVELPAFVPFVGWRQYRLPLPPRALRAGMNVVRVATTGPGPVPPPFAITYVRLVFDGPSSPQGRNGSAVDWGSRPGLGLRRSLRGECFSSVPRRGLASS